MEAYKYDEEYEIVEVDDKAKRTRIDEGKVVGIVAIICAIISPFVLGDITGSVLFGGLACCALIK